jgi:hypothetical protein
MAQQHQGDGGCARGQQAGMDHAMMARMDSLDARLDSLATLMRTTRGDRKVNAMAEILAMLVDHQREMRRTMHERMMQQGQAGGMDHQHAAGPGGMNCQMMRSDSSKAAGGAHNH